MNPRFSTTHLETLQTAEFLRRAAGFVRKLRIRPKGGWGQRNVAAVSRPMLAVSGGTLWLMSTPRGQRGFFYEEWANGGAEWLVRALATKCPRIKPKFLVEEKG